MAKLIASMPLAVAFWLIVTLAVIVRLTHSTKGCFPLFRCGYSETTEELEENVMNLNEKKLQTLGKRYVKLLHEESDSIGFDEVNRTLTKIYNLSGQYRSFNPKKMGLSESWGNLVSLKNYRDACHHGVLKFTDYASTPNVNGHQRRFAFECFRSYLEKCGLEERFKKITDSIKQKSSQHLNLYTFPSFYSYLEAEFWPQKSETSGGADEMKSDLELLLSAIGRLPALGSISKESDCSNFMTIELLHWMANLKRCQNLLSDYFALYLDTCGYEDRFKRIVDSIEQPTDKSRFSEDYPTLNAYFKKEFFTKVPKDLGSIRDELVNLIAVLKHLTDKIDCNDRSKRELVKSLFDNSQSSLRVERIYFTQYLKNCGYEERFKEITDSMKQKSHLHRNSYTSTTFNSYLEAKFWPKRSKKSELKELLTAVEELPALAIVSKEIDCSEDLTTNLLYWTANIRECRDFFEDYFALYLETCGYEERFKEIIDSIKQPTEKSQFSYAYPTLNEYLKRKFSKKVLSEKFYIRKKLVELLSMMNSFTDTPDCSERFKNKLIGSISDGGWSLLELKRIYLSRYLDNCGYEEQFIKVKAQHKIFANERNLVGYLFGFSLEDSRRFAENLSLTLSVIKKLADFGRNEESKCDNNSTEFMHELRSHEGKAAEDVLKRDIELIFQDYKEGCTDHFKLMVEKFKRDHADKMALIEKSTDLIDLKLGFRFKSNPDEELQSFILPEVARKFDGGQSGIAGVEEREKFIEKLKADCQFLLDYMDQDLFTMSYAYVFVLEAKYDNDVKKFMKYLSCCSRISSRPDAKLESMFFELGMPFYPRKIDLSRPKQDAKSDARDQKESDFELLNFSPMTGLNYA